MRIFAEHNVLIAGYIRYTESRSPSHSQNQNRHPLTLDQAGF